MSFSKDLLDTKLHFSKCQHARGTATTCYPLPKVPGRYFSIAPHTFPNVCKHFSKCSLLAASGSFASNRSSPMSKVLHVLGLFLCTLDHFSWSNILVNWAFHPSAPALPCLLSLAEAFSKASSKSLWALVTESLTFLAFSKPLSFPLLL